MGNKKENMNFNKLNNTLILIYKLVGVALLSLCALAVVAYATLFLFYSFNRDWAAPITLSPSQERVLSVRPQVTMLEAGLDKTKIELGTFKAQIINKAQQLNQIDTLLRRIDGAQSNEALAMSETDKSINSVLKDQQKVINDSAHAVSETNRLENAIEDELAANLITRDQAASRLISIQAARSAAVAAKASALSLYEQARQARTGADTLRGGASSLAATQSLYQEQQLRAIRAQTEIDLMTANAAVEALSKTLVDGEKVLTLARMSPYHQAMDRIIYLAFVPYSNIKIAKVGDKIYDCYLHIIVCREVGIVTRVYEPEEYARHPLFRTDLKGKMIEAEYQDMEASRSQVVFIGRKPLLL